MFQFYFSFVVHFLIALNQPSDDENMQMLRKELEERQSEGYEMNNDNVAPLEWLHLKVGHDIELISCLLHHDDFLKDTNICLDSDKRVESIEACLLEKPISKWEGTVSQISSDGLQGTITFNKHFPVRFVPLNAQPRKPSIGDSVKFCLSFDMFGLMAWQVMYVLETKKDDDDDRVSSKDDNSSSRYSKKKEMEDKHNDGSRGPIQPDGKQRCNGCKSPPLQDEEILEKRCKWDEHREQPVQGRISFTNPVIVLFFEGNIAKNILLDSKVGKSTDRARAADVRVLKVEKCKFYNFLFD